MGVSHDRVARRAAVLVRSRGVGAHAVHIAPNVWRAFGDHACPVVRTRELAQRCATDTGEIARGVRAGVRHRRRDNRSAVRVAAIVVALFLVGGVTYLLLPAGSSASGQSKDASTPGSTIVATAHADTLAVYAHPADPQPSLTLSPPRTFVPIV